MRNHLPKIVLFAAALLAGTTNTFAGTPLTPDTTLATETGNNTSAASTFTTLSNGDIAPGNVSKVSIKGALYAGSDAKVYAHLMGWFGGTNHMNVGYSSDSTTQVHKQVMDMISRGFDGAIMDWYGPNSTRTNTTTQYLKAEAELHSGFQFSFNYDGGALKACAATSGCSVTQQTISDLTYAYNNYELSPAFIRYGGRPVVYTFGTEAYSIDWTTVQSSVPGSPMFIFRNSGGFSKTDTSGGYSWVAPETVTSTDPLALGYLDNFYQTSLSYSQMVRTGSAYAGFNDSLASWGKNFYIPRDCGQTWLTTLAQEGHYYSNSNQLWGMQLVTWNDYEEGTEFESGIDNCVNVTSTMSGTTLKWSATGQPNTIDHYTLFISADGQNLMTLGNVPVTQSSLDLAPFGFAAGTYSAFVKAVGAPSLTNKMSNASTYTVTSTNQPPTLTISATPSTGIAPATVMATAVAADSDGTINAVTINFGDGSAPVQFTSAVGTSASHVYNTPGSYTITATATDSSNAQTTTTTTVAVAADEPPQTVLSVTPASGTAPVVVTASTAASTDADGSIASSSINFGDGTVVSGPTASHTYSTPGTYTVRGTTTDNLGLSSSQSTTVTVVSSQPPTVAMQVTPTTGDTGTTASAAVNATTTNGTITSSSIDFGDGTVVSGSSASHKYSVAGSYTVRATVKDSAGLTASTALPVTIMQPSIAINSPAGGSTWNTVVPVSATANAFTALSAMQVYIDGSLKFQQSTGSLNQSFTLAAGSHSITVKGWDANGTSFMSHVSVTVNANQPPVAALSVSPSTGIRVGTSVSASAAASTDSDGSIASYSIGFGDGTVANTPSATHAYAAAGTYTITAKVTDNLGATSTKQQSVTVSTNTSSVNTTTSSVTVYTPVNNSTISGSMAVSAVGYAPKGVKAMQVYVDGSLKYQVASATVNTSLSVSTGTHKVTVQGWDTAGAYFKSSSLTVTIN